MSKIIKGYTSMRFIGIVKDEYRAMIAKVVLMKDWSIAEAEFIQSFIETETVWDLNKVPFSELSRPKLWLSSQEKIKNEFNEDTGEWKFTYSSNQVKENYFFFNTILPEIIETVEHCEVHRDEVYIFGRNYDDCELIDKGIVTYEFKQSRWMAVNHRWLAPEER